MSHICTDRAYDCSSQRGARAQELLKDAEGVRGGISYMLHVTFSPLFGFVTALPHRFRFVAAFGSRRDPLRIQPHPPTVTQVAGVLLFSARLRRSCTCRKLLPMRASASSLVIDKVRLQKRSFPSSSAHFDGLLVALTQYHGTGYGASKRRRERLTWLEDRSAASGREIRAAG